MHHLQIHNVMYAAYTVGQNTCTDLVGNFYIWYCMVPYMWRIKIPEGVNWGNVQICAFLALTGHSQPLHPIGPFLLLIKACIMSCTRMCLHPCKSHCAQFDRCSSSRPDHQNFPNGVAFHEKTAYIRVYHQPLHRLTPYLLR